MLANHSAERCLVCSGDNSCFEDGSSLSTLVRQNIIPKQGFLTGDFFLSSFFFHYVFPKESVACVGSFQRYHGIIQICFYKGRGFTPLHFPPPLPPT